MSFDDTPLGAASLAQVHKAVLHDGRTVAVKVQHPKVQSQSSKDILLMEVRTFPFLLPCPHSVFSGIQEASVNLVQGWWVECGPLSSTVGEESLIPWQRRCQDSAVAMGPMTGLVTSRFAPGLTAQCVTAGAKETSGGCCRNEMNQR